MRETGNVQLFTSSGGIKTGTIRFQTGTPSTTKGSSGAIEMSTGNVDSDNVSDSAGNFSILVGESNAGTGGSIEMVGAVYTFGFIAMTPQLFINYKLRSVAHLPWKFLMFRALNTFIDDLFAFIIRMPTMVSIQAKCTN